MEWLPGDLSGYLYSVLFVDDNALYQLVWMDGMIFPLRLPICSGAPRAWPWPEILCGL
jgi:hypothetical protein